MAEEIVYGCPYHLLTELWHRAWWEIRTHNYDLNVTREEKKLSLNELEEIR